MNWFESIGINGAADLAMVGPGISEALITTATGIAAAIPAVVAYNHFAGQIKRLAVDMDCFSQDFINIIQRSLTTGKNSARWRFQCRKTSGSRVPTTLAEINVTPLVDVMLVLLIVFMVSAPMMQQGLRVDLPKASAGKSARSRISSCWSSTSPGRS